MTKKIVFAFLAFFAIQINAQTIDDKIEELLELNGTIDKIEEIIANTIEYQKQNNIGVPDNYWEVLENKVSKKSTDEFLSIIIPIYSQNYTESEIDDLTTFFNSKTGILIAKKQSIILNQLSLPTMQWSQNLSFYIIEQIENRGKNESSSDEIEKFKTEFIAKYGLQILNLKDLAIDQENNIGSLLIDFGKTDGKEDITKIIRVKNNSNKEITFDKPTFLINDDFKFDWGNKPIKVGEIRDLKIILNAEEAENKSYSFFSIYPSEGSSISIGVKYNAPSKKLEFEVFKKKMKYKKSKQDLSDPYIFLIKNIGGKEFHISDIEIDVPIAYLNYSTEALEQNQEIEIRVIISKELIKSQNIENVKLNLEVNLKKGKKGNSFTSYPDKTIELIIE